MKKTRKLMEIKSMSDCINRYYSHTDVTLIISDYSHFIRMRTVRNSVLVPWIQYRVHLVFIAVKLSSSTSSPLNRPSTTPSKPPTLNTRWQLRSRHYYNQVWNCISMPLWSSTEWSALWVPTVILKSLFATFLL